MKTMLTTKQAFMYLVAVVVILSGVLLMGYAIYNQVHQDTPLPDPTVKM